MSVDSFNRARLSDQLRTIKETGGTADERAFVRELHRETTRNPRASLADAEARAWQNVILENMGGAK